MAIENDDPFITLSLLNYHNRNLLNTFFKSHRKDRTSQIVWVLGISVWQCSEHADTKGHDAMTFKNIYGQALTDILVLVETIFLPVGTRSKAGICRPVADSQAGPVMAGEGPTWPPASRHGILTPNNKATFLATFSSVGIVFVTPGVTFAPHGDQCV